MENPNPHIAASRSDFYVYLLQAGIKSRDLFIGRLVHARVIKEGLYLGIFLMNNLVNFYAKTGSVSDAHLLFNEMSVKSTFSWNTILSALVKGGNIEAAHHVFDEIPNRDSVSWTTMIVGFNRMGLFNNAIQLFLRMISDRILPTQFTFTNVLSSCAAIEALDIGRKVHSFVLKLGVSSVLPVANSLLNMYAKSGDSITAKVIFDRMSLKNTSSWNNLISMYIQFGRLDLAISLFEQMTERDVVSWNSVISGYNRWGFDIEALETFSYMIKSSALKPDNFTLSSILSACANLENLKFGKQIHAHIIRNDMHVTEMVINALISMYAKSGGIEFSQRIVELTSTSRINVIAFTSLLDGYVKIGDVKPAREIFDSMKGLDVVAWTAMIVGYVQNGLISNALELFRSMIGEGPKPNSYTVAAILSVISSLASLDLGKQVHATTIRSGEASSISVGNALITMYSRAGSVKDARQVFKQICCNRDTVSWTSMIIALAQHGLGKEAIELFEKMVKFNIKPDHITFVGVLSACTHVGLVEQGKGYFNLMKTIHHIEPTHSHYACMVDLLGRAGLLEEAYNFIKNMPIEPDHIAWGSLLASCRVHKKVDLAKVAAEKLLLIDPNNSGAYAALANTFSASGKWQEAAKVRKSMKDNAVKKEQGFSWVQIQNKVHVFGVEDGLHPQKDAIYNMISKIWEEIKKMGFTPDTDSVLHDLEQEVKEQILRHHSEKLAIAFALINTPENTTLRIMKNLRVCSDCHSAIKYISRLVSREIIVRDATRFHHFKDGSCSCLDYW
ncbi:pentatricopeptide repeat-containing protein At2g22070 [Prosopis cineraria]|uniref:pentatricopeptide repeat-containing protein At2g22070 n=1 Tax=Prosopis cineraria TaxID=364024 RepID=UPI0024107104|nr:pentatricopeptide repeat-containing protein At2g22070 [Prosopis cineraria]XP_054798547.1 pentatricopeptide repeat-containing protein At2g22070 [Prosopis cineraria]XP_054798549.1 pentatricopeptide repeat-containing protein At2g22070 [Prosopis cineraria]XP_054798550.1 pentatricopeptide repeat-containing protein At2g22070 [Prosopis cineraria]XP_054798551.1 pentatricopeptide repeat-containing protein At2g22070 [Prosopis cineraria]XP_054798552.1 pentatricopeptide repeat-containing protein At2g22